MGWNPVATRISRRSGGGTRSAGARRSGDHDPVITTGTAGDRGRSRTATGTSLETVRRDGVLASWAPSGRSAVPAIIGLVVVANLVGVVTVALLLLGVEDRGGNTGRTPVLLVAAAYLAVAFPLGTVTGLRRQRA